MPTQKIVWTALPNGPVAGKAGTLSLGVYVALQLTDAATLAAFPDLLDWPTTLKGLKLKVTIAGNAPLTVAPKSTGDSALWRAFFPSTLTVQSFRYLTELPNLALHSYSVLSVADALKDFHKTVLNTKLNTSGNYDLPDHDTLAKKLFELSPPATGTKLPKQYQPFVSELGTKDLSAGINALTKKRSAQNLTATERRAADMTAARLFQTVGKDKNRAVTAKLDIPATVMEKPLEFHDIVALLEQYPPLQKALGLVLELEVPFAGAIPANATVAVAPDWPASPLRKDISAKTALTPGAFYAASVDGSSERGFLKVSDERLFGTTLLDTDAGAAQLHIASDQLASRLNSPVSAPIALTMLPGEKEAPPVLERDSTPFAGVPSLKTAGVTLAQTKRAATFQLSLNRSLQNAKNLSQNTPPTLYAEDITRGWRVDVRKLSGATPGPWFSLCRRAGSYTVRGRSGTFDATDEGFVSGVTTEQDGKEGLQVHEALFRWSGWSLCVPRPGQPVPDGTLLASALNPTWALTTAEFKVPTKSLLALRFGQTYQMRVRLADMAGNGPLPESAESSSVTRPEPFLRYDPILPPQVIRRRPFTPGESAHRLVIRSVDEKAKAGEPCERHIAPPVGTVELAEYHGMFDGVAPEKSYAWLRDLQKPHKEEDARPGPLKSEYLADPLAQSAAFGNTLVPFGDPKQWPETKSIVLRLEEGPATSALVKNGVMTVVLPKAETVTLSLSSVPQDGKRLDELAHWHTLKNNPQGQNPNVLFGTAMHGGNWQLTPWHELTFVHAVQKPLLAPDFKSCSGGRRALGSRTTDLSAFRLTCHGKSTDSVELVPSWDEITDQPKIGRVATRMSGTGYEIALRFKDNVVPEKANTPLRDPDGYQRTTYAPATQEIFRSAAGNGITGKNPTLTLPDTKYRRVTLTPVATTRFRDYFPAAIYNNPDNITRAGAAAVLDVLSSARPDAPEVVAIAPIFKWSRSKDRSQRQTGLRVWLKPDWFSSGDGEQLAIVLAPATAAANPGAYLPYVTQWGSDPVWADDVKLSQFVKSGDLKPSKKVPLTASPRPPVIQARPIGEPELVQVTPGERLDESLFDRKGLPLAEANLTVDILSYDVAFDTERGLWYADLPLATTAYTPFIRLALARYQGRSMPSCHLSRVVVTDFAQLLPERTVALVREGGKVRLTLTGPAPQSTAGAQVRAFAFLQSQKGLGELDWVMVGAVPLEGNPGSWSATLPQAAAGQRVLITELELFGSTGRVVFAETVPL